MYMYMETYDDHRGYLFAMKGDIRMPTRFQICVT